MRRLWNVLPVIALAVAAFFGCAPLVWAEFAQPRAEQGLVKATTRQAAALTRGEQAKPSLMITEETEILVDGQRCGMAQVPAGAEIILLDVAADRSKIRRIHFQTRK